MSVFDEDRKVEIQTAVECSDLGSMLHHGIALVISNYSSELEQCLALVYTFNRVKGRTTDLAEEVADYICSIEFDNVMYEEGPEIVDDFNSLHSMVTQFESLLDQHVNFHHFAWGSEDIRKERYLLLRDIEREIVSLEMDYRLSLSQYRD